MTDTPQISNRKYYATPQVQVFGDLAELTRTHNNGHGLNDNGGGSSSKNTAP